MTSAEYVRRQCERIRASSGDDAAGICMGMLPTCFQPPPPGGHHFPEIDGGTSYDSPTTCSRGVLNFARDSAHKEELLLLSIFDHLGFSPETLDPGEESEIDDSDFLEGGRKFEGRLLIPDEKEPPAIPLTIHYSIKWNDGNNRSLFRYKISSDGEDMSKGIQSLEFSREEVDRLKFQLSCRKSEDSCAFPSAITIVVR